MITHSDYFKEIVVYPRTGLKYKPRSLNFNNKLKMHADAKSVNNVVSKNKIIPPIFQFFDLTQHLMIKERPYSIQEQNRHRTFSYDITHQASETQYLR